MLFPLFILLSSSAFHLHQNHTNYDSSSPLAAVDHPSANVAFPIIAINRGNITTSNDKLPTKSASGRVDPLKMTPATNDSSWSLDCCNNSSLFDLTEPPPPLPSVAYLIAPGNGSNGRAVDPFYREFRDQSRFWIQRILVPLITFVGVIGNSMTIVIMTRRRMRSSTNIYLAALAIIDMVYLISVFALSFKHYPNAADRNYYLYWTFHPFVLMITDACSNISAWLTVTFTLERLIVVWSPIRGKVLCTEARARKVILVVFLVCFTCTLPVPFEWVVTESINLKTNTTKFDLKESDLGRNALYKTIYYRFTSITFSFIPLILLAVFNSFLIRSVHVSRRQRSKMTHSIVRRTPTSTNASSQPKITISGAPSLMVNNGANGGLRGSRDVSPKSPASGRSPGSRLSDHSTAQETKITIMLIAVVLLFMVCQIPWAIMLIYNSFQAEDASPNSVHLITAINNIFNFLMAINAAGNFLLYSLLSKRYRKTCVQLFCPCVKSKLKHNSEWSSKPATVEFAAG